MTPQSFDGSVNLPSHTYWLTNLFQAAWMVEQGFTILDLDIRPEDNRVVLYFAATPAFFQTLDAYKRGLAVCRIRAYVEAYAYVRGLVMDAHQAREGQVAE